MTTERSHDLKFDKGTIYIVYFHTHVHVHIEKMGNLSKSKLKLYICDNKLRSYAQFAPRGTQQSLDNVINIKISCAGSKDSWEYARLHRLA